MTVKVAKFEEINSKYLSKEENGGKIVEFVNM